MKEKDVAALEYVLNKFLPYIGIVILLFSELNFYSVTPWVILALAFFIDRFSIKIGRSIGEYENNPEFKQDVDKTLDE